MRHGISHLPLPNPAAWAAPPREFAGIPVHMRREWGLLAEARGIGPWKHIVVGGVWTLLPRAQQEAALWHEVGHCRLWHKEIRLLLLPLFWTKWARAITHAQELAADQFAKRAGLGLDLAWVITRFSGYSSTFYPSIADRVSALTGVQHENAA